MNPNRLSWLVFALLSVTGGSCAEPQKAGPPPSPPIVFVTAVARRDVPLFIDAVGTLDGYINAEIRARVRGYLRSQDYKDGSAVKAGDTLFSIEPNEFAVALASARAALSRARVSQAHGAVQVERDRGLSTTGMISRQDLDNATATLADAEGQVQAAQAQVEQAELNLSYTRVHSPIDGVAGLALVRVGNLVGQDSPTLLTTVSRVDPIRVNFTMSEVDYVKNPERFKNLEQRDLAWVKAQFARVEAGAAAVTGDRGIELVLADGSVYPHRGITTTVDRQIDPTTGTIQLQALIPNPNGALRPGQYGHVRIRRDDAGRDVLVVPEKALISVQGSSSLGVVGSDNKVQMRRVEVGPASSGMRIIDKGVSEGERVVVEGVQKITDGATVDPKPAPEGAGGLSSAPAAPAASQARSSER